MWYWSERLLVEYIIDHLLPAYQVHILAGASGSGKTDFLLQHIRDIIDGKEFFGHKVNPISLYYIGCDRLEAEYQEKFVLRSIPPFPLTSLISDPNFHPRILSRPENRTSALDLLLKKVRLDVPDANLLIFDPLSPFLPAKLHDYHLIADALVDLGRWCEENRITIIGTHHATKLKPDTTFRRMQDRILGSAALLGYSGTHLFLSSPEELGQPYASLTINPHNFPPETHNLTRDDQGRFIPYIEEDQTQITQLDTALIIPDPPATITTFELISNHPGLSKKTIYRKLETLISEGKVVKIGHGVYQSTSPFQATPSL